MKVLVLSQYFSPEPIPKPFELAEALMEEGHKPSILTGLPNYPSGQLYEGYRLGLIQRETVGGIPVFRTFEYPYHGSSAVLRIVHYLSFMFSSVFGSLFTGPCDVIYTWHPPLTVGISAWLISIIKRAPVVYDVQDIWPESVVLSGLLSDGPLVRVMSWLERFVYARVHHILVPTEGARENLIGKGVPPLKVTVLPHWVDESIFELSDEGGVRAEIRQRMGWEDRFVVLFAGNLGIVQGLETVIEAATQIRRKDILFVLMGDGASRKSLEKLANDRDVKEHVEFIGRKPIGEVPAHMAAADVLLVHLRPSGLSRLVLPSKTMAYLAAAKPLLMAMEGAAADLVRRAECGLVIPPGDPERLARAAEELSSFDEATRSELGHNGRVYLREHLSRRTVVASYIEALRSVLAPEHPEARNASNE